MIIMVRIANRKIYNLHELLKKQTTNSGMGMTKPLIEVATYHDISRAWRISVLSISDDTASTTEQDGIKM